jgi:hypothetical protein
MGVQYGKSTVQSLYNMYQNSGGSKKKKPQIQRLKAAKVSKPSFQGGIPVAYSSRQNARMGQGKQHVVAASELLASVNGSVDFASTKFPLNPGLASVFPRLSKEAAVWQHYRFKKLSFRYVTRSSTNTAGSVILSPSYNPAEIAPSNETEASNTAQAVEDVTWSKEITCRLKPGSMYPLGPKKQVRYFNIPGDLNVYDVGNLYVCTKGQIDASEIGKLWVDYEVEFYIPQSTPITPYPRDMTIVTMAPSDIKTTDGVLEVVWTAPNAASNPLDISLDSKSTKVILPRGAYSIGTTTFISTTTASAKLNVDHILNGVTINSYYAVSVPTNRTEHYSLRVIVATEPAELEILIAAISGDFTGVKITLNILNI